MTAKVDTLTLTPGRELDRPAAPKLIIGLMNGELARGLDQYFRGLGWRVCCGDTTHEIRRKAHGGRAAAIALSVAAFHGESAFLTCAKLVRSLPRVRVVLVGPNSEEAERFALFAGAAGYVCETAGVAEIAAALIGAGKAKRP